MAEIIDVESGEKIPVHAHVSWMSLWGKKYVESHKELAFMLREAKNILERFKRGQERFWTAYFIVADNMSEENTDYCWADVLCNNPGVTPQLNEQCKFYHTLRPACFIEFLCVCCLDQAGSTAGIFITVYSIKIAWTRPVLPLVSASQIAPEPRSHPHHLKFRDYHAFPKIIAPGLPHIP